MATLTPFYFSLFLFHSLSISLSFLLILSLSNSLSLFLFHSLTFFSPLSPYHPTCSFLFFTPLFSLKAISYACLPLLSLSCFISPVYLHVRPSVRLSVCLSVYLSVLPFYRNVLDLLSLSFKIFDRDTTVFRNLRSVNSTLWRLSNNSNFLLFPRVVKHTTFLN